MEKDLLSVYIGTCRLQYLLKVTCLNAVRNKYEFLNWSWKEDLTIALTGGTLVPCLSLSVQSGWLAAGSVPVSCSLDLAVVAITGLARE